MIFPLEFSGQIALRASDSKTKVLMAQGESAEVMRLGCLEKNDQVNHL